MLLMQNRNDGEVVGVVQKRHRHENTSLLMCFHAQCGVGKATTTKRLQRWCLFVLGVSWAW
jgi:hypothetical protein